MLLKAIKNKKNNPDETIKRNFTFSFDGEEIYEYNLENDDVTPHIPATSVLRTKCLFEEHNCGTMKNVCTICGALYFKNEASVSGVYRGCCQPGKVKYHEKKVYPEVLKKILPKNNIDTKSFRVHVGSYNSAVSLVSMCAKLETVGIGHYCFEVHGQV